MASRLTVEIELDELELELDLLEDEDQLLELLVCVRLELLDELLVELLEDSYSYKKGVPLLLKSERGGPKGHVTTRSA